MAKGTRMLLPALPALIRHIEQTRNTTARMLAAARDTPQGASFDLDGQRLQRAVVAADTERIYTVIADTGRRRDLTREEDAAFWTWAIFEVRHHTGIRLEEP